MSCQIYYRIIMPLDVSGSPGAAIYTDHKSLLYDSTTVSDSSQAVHLNYLLDTGLWWRTNELLLCFTRVYPPQKG